MFVERPGGRLSYTIVESDQPRIAEPETLILHHGVGTTHQIWRNWLPVMAQKYRMVMLDMRGCGESVFDDPSAWTLDDLSNDILAVADAIDARQFHVAGESLGGTVVLNLIARGLDRVLTATTVSAAHRGGQIERVRAWRDDLAQNGIRSWSQAMMDHRFFPGALGQDAFDWFQALQDQTDPNVLTCLGELLLGADLTPQLGKIQCPLLMILPDRSPFVTPDIGVEILGNVTSAELCVLPHTRHGIVFSHGGICASHCGNFIERHSPR